MEDVELAGKISATQKEIADLEGERTKEADADKKGELDASITAAGDQLTRLQEQQYYDRSAENLSKSEAPAAEKDGDEISLPIGSISGETQEPAREKDQAEADSQKSEEQERKSLETTALIFDGMPSRGITAEQYSEMYSQMAQSSKEQPGTAEDFIRLASSSQQAGSEAPVQEREAETEAATQSEVAPESIQAVQAEAEEAIAERYAQDSGMEARHIEQGEEIQGEIADKAEIDGQTYYAIDSENEQTGEAERVLVPAGKTSYDQGDEISAVHNGQDIEIEEARSYGR